MRLFADSVYSSEVAADAARHDDALAEMVWDAFADRRGEGSGSTVRVGTDSGYVAGVMLVGMGRDGVFDGVEVHRALSGLWPTGAFGLEVERTADAIALEVAIDDEGSAAQAALPERQARSRRRRGKVALALQALGARIEPAKERSSSGIRAVWHVPLESRDAVVMAVAA